MPTNTANANLFYLLAILGHETVMLSGMPACKLAAHRQRVLDCLKMRGLTVESLLGDVPQRLQRAIESGAHKGSERQVPSWVASLCVLSEVWRLTADYRGIVVELTPTPFTRDSISLQFWPLPGQAEVLALRARIERVPA